MVARGGLLHDLVEGVGIFLLKSYHANKFARQAMDKMNMAKWVLATPFFDLPDDNQMEHLINALPEKFFPRVICEQPVLIEVWKQGDQSQVHLMNYGQSLQQVSLIFEAPVKGMVISPDGPVILDLVGEEISFILDIYSVLILEALTY
jgi:hypothetical protein